MSIFLNKDSKVIVQGITGNEGSVHTARMLEAGTRLVGGVNARKAGTTVSHTNARGDEVELPVSGTVAETMQETGADVSVVFVPPKFAKDAIIEAIDAEIPLLVVITERIPVQDNAYAWQYNLDNGGAKAPKTRIIGPNCPGVITPGEALAGIIPANITGPGPIGLVSRSGTLTYQMMYEMYELRDFGSSTCIGIGGDPVIGTTHIDAIEAFENDPDTKIIVIIGEIGGDAEERAADYIKANVSKPVLGYIAGFTPPEGKTMGHAGAIVSGSSGTAAAKKEALEPLAMFANEVDEVRRLLAPGSLPVTIFPEGTPGAGVVALKRVDELGSYNLNIRGSRRQAGNYAIYSDGCDCRSGPEGRLRMLEAVQVGCHQGPPVLSQIYSDDSRPFGTTK